MRKIANKNKTSLTETQCVDMIQRAIMEVDFIFQLWCTSSLEILVEVISLLARVSWQEVFLIGFLFIIYIFLDIDGRLKD